MGSVPLQWIRGEAYQAGGNRQLMTAVYRTPPAPPPGASGELPGGVPRFFSDGTGGGGGTGGLGTSGTSVGLAAAPAPPPWAAESARIFAMLASAVGSTRASRRPSMSLRCATMRYVNGTLLRPPPASRTSKPAAVC